jgi:KUP system potassium uptake protein
MPRSGKTIRSNEPPVKAREDNGTPLEFFSSKTLVMAIGALGVVYGDIGTSPLYTIPVCFSKRWGLPADTGNVLGVVSLIIWSLVIIISVKYLVVILRADLNGEGGILALTTLVTSAKAKAPSNRWLLPLGLFGAALLIGDGMITPAMSVLSAVEGVEVVQPALAKAVVPLCIGILLGLFALQKHGTENIGRWAGPVMLGWFGVIAVLGIRGICLAPEVLRAVDPSQAMQLLITHGDRALFVLGFVFLAVTGGEALYADLGHFGRRPIRLGWFTLVFPALVLNYLGQGGLLLHDPGAADSSFFRLAPSLFLYPLIALATVATVVASQAIVSGAFSLIHQARELNYAPQLKVVHYSDDGEGKVYVPLVNWSLAVATILLVITFRSSDALAGAYGMAVAGTMLITTLLVVVCFRRLWNWSWPLTILVGGIFLMVDSSFLTANLVKLFDGGWIPLAVASIVYLVMSTWRIGRNALESARYVSDKAIADLCRQADAGKLTRVSGTAVYFSNDSKVVPLTLLVNAQHNRILHERIIILTITTKEVPRITASKRLESSQVAPGFIRLIACYGFMQTPNVGALMNEATKQGIIDGTRDLTYFVRSEDIVLTKNKTMAHWRKRFYAFLSRNSQDATSMWNVPDDQTVGLRISTKL